MRVQCKFIEFFLRFMITTLHEEQSANGRTCEALRTLMYSKSQNGVDLMKLVARKKFRIVIDGLTLIMI